MKSYATHRASLRTVGFALVAVASLTLLTTSCDDKPGLVVDLDAAIRVNDASEEVLGVIVDAINDDQLLIDDDKAAAIVSPEPGASVPRAEPWQFAWASPNAAPGGGKTPRHGLATGDFVWLRLSGGGLARDIDVIAVNVSSWTPTAAEWTEISAATGPISITLTNAFVMDGVLKDGPYRGSGTSTFSIAP